MSWCTKYIGTSAQSTFEYPSDKGNMLSEADKKIDDIAASGTCQIGNKTQEIASNQILNLHCQNIATGGVH